MGVHIRVGDIFVQKMTFPAIWTAYNQRSEVSLENSAC